MTHINSVRDYLEQTSQGLRRSTRRATTEALVSIAQTALLLGVGGVLGGAVIGSRMNDNPPPPPVTWVSTSLSLLLLGGGVLRSLDAIADTEHAMYLNSSGTRNRVTEKVLDAGLDYLTTPQFITQSLAPVTTGAPLDERAWLEQMYHQPAIVPSPPHDVAPTEMDLAQELGRAPRSSIIIGQPGAGKGRLVAQALVELKRHHPDVQVWMINPKDDPGEEDYWRSVDEMCPAKLTPFATQAETDEFMSAVDEFIERFRSAPSPKLLVLDELLAVKEATPRKWFTRFMAGANAVCSMGRSLQSWGWLISQSPNADDIGISGGARNVYRRVLLVHAEDKGVLSGGSSFFQGQPEPELFQCPSARVFYDSAGTGWGSLPRY